MRANPDITIQALSNKIGVSTRAIELQITKLKEAGKIERVGADKNGYWNVIE